MHARGRILHVEDDEATSYARSVPLRRAGFDVTLAQSGSEGLWLAPGADVVLLDIDLPDLSGIDVFCRLRRDARTREIPVVHITALDLDLHPRERVAASLADELLDARCPAHRLVSTLVEVVDARRRDAVPEPGTCARCGRLRRFADLDESAAFFEEVERCSGLDEIAALPETGLNRVVRCDSCASSRLRRFAARLDVPGSHGRVA